MQAGHVFKGSFLFINKETGQRVSQGISGNAKQRRQAVRLWKRKGFAVQVLVYNGRISNYQ